MVKDKMYCHSCLGHSLCCTHVQEILDNRDNMPDSWKIVVDEFPYKAREDGSCEKLMEGGGCEVYEDRPSLCNIPKVREVVAADTPIDKWFKEQEHWCRVLMKDSGKFTEEEIKELYTDEAKEKYWAEKSLPEDRN